VNRDAPILCCTAEILANIALREGAAADVRDVVMDEFHYYADRERGGAWQVPLLTLPQTRFLLMSATLGDTSFFEAELTKRTGRPTATVKSTDRPVPLEHLYSELPLAQNAGESGRRRQGAGVRGAFHAIGSRAKRAGFHEHQRLHRATRSTRSRTRWKDSSSPVRTGRTSRNGCGTASACITRGCCRSIAC
jgi:superfamily II RNA helicase